jgi:hypothetical protein
VAVGAAVGAGVAVGATVGVAVGIGVTVAVGVGVGVGAMVGEGMTVGVGVGSSVGDGGTGTTGVRFGGPSGTSAKSALLLWVLMRVRSALRRRSIIVVDDIAGVGVPKPPALDVALPQETVSATSVGVERMRRRTAPPVAAIPSLHVASAPAENVPRLFATSSRAPAASGAAPSRLIRRRVVAPLAVV